MNLRPDSAKGFQWWTIGWGVERVWSLRLRWLKLGPLSIARLAYGSWAIGWELHWMNRLVAVH